MRKLMIPVMLAVLGVCGLASRLVVPDAQAAVGPAILQGTSETKDWASLVDGAGASEDVVVEGAALGDYCLASMSLDIVDILVTCNVTAANTATVRLQNETTGTVDLASGTLRVMVIKKPSTGRGS